LVADSALTSTYRNYLNRKLVLGGDSRPRGYVSASFRGGSGFAASLELRTFGVNVLSARVGAVAFYDVGGTGDSVKDGALHHSVGAGLRVLFPQVNRQCFRVDWAAPLTAGSGRIPDRALPGGVYFTFGQAFDMPGARLPTISGFREFAEAGGLMSYGANTPDLFRRAAEFVDKILRGAKPGDLPVEQPTKFDIVINLTTAKILGLTIPESFLLRADEVIE
jgi:hypothetical protein